ncbi:hypothetical protein [Aliiruegeria sabulilitoris]|uniref:hypothetical protein n=1 Tax=Aliiruegeria sabulilitoris TaxID=1510458 RepID=UPI000AFBB1C2|nr:hypothetical protein [Aliiruegeria sabulilitoris]NDR57029.1 hypothetical protein [Pseudoruegeria sp. M32A2M]
MSVPRYFVEGISKVDPDTSNGIVKLTFHIKENGKPEDAVQLIVSVDNLNQSFQMVGETMQKTFGQGGGGRPPGGGGRPGGGRPPGGGGRPGMNPNLKDLTEK